MYVELGFVLDDGRKILRTIDTLRKANSFIGGHIELAYQIIEAERWEHEFHKSDWRNHPVDFLLYEKGALKIGTKYGDRKVSYYPPKLTRKADIVLCEYKSRQFDIEEIRKPGNVESIVRFFHQ